MHLFFAIGAQKKPYIYTFSYHRAWFAPRACLALASRYLHFQPLLNAQWHWCVLQNLSSKLIFDYDSKYTRLFTKATFETLLASQPLAPVHLSVCTIHTWLRVSLLVCKYSFFFLQKNLVSSYSQGWPPWISLPYSSIHFPFLSLFYPYATEMFSHFFHFTRRLTNFFFVYFYMISSCFSHFALFPQCSMSFQQRGTGWIFSSPNRLFLDINNESWVDDETSQSMERSRPMKIFKRS